MLLGAHSLEKGMGLRQTKKGYGKDKAKKVLTHMQYWKECGYALDNFAFLETTAVIEAYIRYQVEKGEDVEEIIKLCNNVKEESLFGMKAAHHTMLDMKYCPMRNYGHKGTLILMPS